MITQFGQLEFKHGNAERGRTIFEGILANHPKKIDLWSVYLDMEIKIGELDTIRHLFNRVINLKLSSKKMKYFLKKYMAFEKENGTPETVEFVRQKANEYVDSITSRS